ncbi:MAG: hypothetical protein V4754_05015 [Pseudomonadota bacterium]
MNKDQLAATLEQQLRAARAERQAAAEPALRAGRDALKQFQAARLAASHADLLAAPDSAAAARFFLHELYGNADLGQRDADLARVIPTMQRLLPLRALHTITEAVQLDALSERLDRLMAQQLAPGFTQAAYLDAFRAVTSRAERERQLDLIGALGASLCELIHIPFLSATLGLMRAPARLAGLGHLQLFLEHGFGAFKRLARPAGFVATVLERERAVLAAVYAGAEQPFPPSGGPLRAP